MCAHAHVCVLLTLVSTSLGPLDKSWYSVGQCYLELYLSKFSKVKFKMSEGKKVKITKTSKNLYRNSK